MFELEKSVKSMPEMNENLLTVTNKIIGYQNIAKNSILAISLILSEVAEKPKEYLNGSGFTKIVDYAECLFGYKKAYTYKLIKISKFISIVDKNGEKLSVDYLLDDNKNHELAENDNFMQFKTIKDDDGFEYSASQMLELIPLTHIEIQNNLKDLDSSLSCKELRDVVKNIVNPPIETTLSDVKDEPTVEENTEPEIILTDKDRILQMLEIAANIENEDVKNKIILIFQKALNAIEKAK